MNRASIVTIQGRQRVRATTKHQPEGTTVIKTRVDLEVRKRKVVDEAQVRPDPDRGHDPDHVIVIANRKEVGGRDQGRDQGHPLPNDRKSEADINYVIWILTFISKYIRHSSIHSMVI